jgi:predicted MFS family arabinose efflux permease
VSEACPVPGTADLPRGSAATPVPDALTTVGATAGVRAPIPAPMLEALRQADARRARPVVIAVFLAFALPLGLMGGAMPVLLARAGLGAAGLGLLLTLHTGAYIAAATLGGGLARRFDPRPLMGRLLLLQLAAAIAVYLLTPAWALGLAMLALGAASGLLDLTMNAEGVAVERGLGRPVLTGMHAAASAGGACGALIGGGVAVLAGAAWCALPALLLSLGAVLALRRLGPAPRRAAVATAPVADPGRQGTDTPARAGVAAGADAGAVPAVVSGRIPGHGELLRRIAPLGLVLGVSIAAESTAVQWSARFLAAQAADLAWLAGAGGALFAGSQAVLRVFGDRLRARLGDRRLMLGSLALAAFGYGVVALAPGFGGALAGFALVGVGTACVVPCGFALAARHGGTASAGGAAALSAAALVAGLVRMPTPLALGAVAGRWSDAVAFGGVAAALLLAWALARRTLPRGRVAGD